MSTNEISHNRISRRQLLKASTSVCIGGTALLAGGAAYMHLCEPGWFELVEKIIPVQGLSSKMEGFRIALVSDLHAGPFMTPERFSRAVTIINNQLPDLVILAGDYVTSDAHNIDAYIPLLSQIMSSFGAFAIMGNHDVWTDPDYITEALESAGICVLRNQQASISVHNHQLVITGLLDSGYVTHERYELASLWTSTIENLPTLPTPGPDLTSLLIAHNPDANELLSESRASLSLSGHTHGGQIRLPFGLGPIYLPSCMGNKYAGGLAESLVGPVYVTRGLGMSGPPVRINCRPEISLLTLASA